MWRHLQIQTGQDQLKIKDPHLGIVRRFGVILSHGRAKNSLLSFKAEFRAFA